MVKHLTFLTTGKIPIIIITIMRRLQNFVLVQSILEKLYSDRSTGNNYLLEYGYTSMTDQLLSTPFVLLMLISLVFVLSLQEMLDDSLI